MQDLKVLATRWYEEHRAHITETLSQLGEYKERMGVTSVKGMPIANAILFPRTRTERRFILPFAVEGEAAPYYLTPYESQQYTNYILAQLNEEYPAGTFSIRRNYEFSIYVKFSEKEVE